MQQCQLQEAIIGFHTIMQNARSIHLVLSLQVSTQATATVYSRRSLDGNSAILQSNAPLLINSCIKEYHLFVDEGEIVLSWTSYKRL